MYASVIIDLNNKNVDQVFDYKIPLSLLNEVKIGTRVIVPFGNRQISGFVINIKDRINYLGNIKEIISVLDKSHLSSLELETVEFIRTRYFNTYNESLMLFIPNALKLNYIKEYKVLNYENLNSILKEFVKDNKIENIDDKYNKIIKEEIKNNNLEINYKIKQKVSEKKIKYYTYKKEYNGSSQNAIKLLAEIKQNCLKRDEILAKYSLSTLNTLIKNDCVLTLYDDIYRLPYIKDIKFPNYDLNDDQKECFKKIDLNNFKEYLLFGVTSSGKTILYLKLIEQMIEKGKISLLLVPEISLTPQISILLKNKFKDDVVILHSNLSVGEKYDTYRLIKEGKAKVVVGPRSALFSVVNENLGLVIIDEEHSDSYIQDNKPNYDAREVASFVCQKLNIPLILGSATPRIESYFKALNNKYELLELKNRALGFSLPSVSIVDMREELKNGNTTVLSKELEYEINKTLSEHKQVILFLNRRGFSTSVMCRNCGHIIKCQKCDIPMTYHKNNNSLVCHHCDNRIDNFSVCPNCGSKKIRFVGLGIEKIEEFIKEKYKGYVIKRLDSDSTNKKNSLEEIYLDFYNNKIDILIGTQMVTKGLDIKNLALVGVINADMAFFYPSYDNTEVAFSLLTQVSGRAGRHMNGKVVIQTYKADDKVIDFVRNQDYVSFYNYEINKRKVLNNPPFKKLKFLKYRGENRLDVLACAVSFVKKYQNINNLIIIGPAENLIFKENNLFNYHVVIKYDNDNDISFLNDYYDNFNHKNIKLKIGDTL